MLTETFNLDLPNPTNLPIVIGFEEFSAFLCSDRRDHVTVAAGVAQFRMAGHREGYPPVEIPIHTSDGRVEVELVSALYVISSKVWLPTREVKADTRRSLFNLIK